MTVYRIGAEGATVWSADGHLLGSLPAGVVIVPGDVVETEQDRLSQLAAKRIRDYADKAVHVVEDKATPPRQPDPRLRNPLAGSG